jgi:hypothetical protein
MLTDCDPFPFGKYKGQRMEDVPASYLDWFDGQPWADSWPEVREYVKRNRSVLNLEIEEGKAE